MDENSYKLPSSWVERIFNRLAAIYKERWEEYLGNERNQTLLKTIWSTGLYGLDPHQIARAITICESSPHSYIPTHIEFFDIAIDRDWETSRPNSF